VKAAYFSEHGEIGNLKIGELEKETIGAREILVKTAYAGLNHLDLFVLKGWPGLDLKMPHILGSDGSGIVEEVGSKVTLVKPGDRVTINPGISCRKCTKCLAGKQNLCSEYSIKGEHFRGTFSEYFKVPEVNALKIPDSYPLDKAAAAPLNFLTAWRMLVTKAQIKPSQIVFVHGAGGGVATAAIQIAKLHKAQVIASTSTETKMQKAKELGADKVFNYLEEPDYSKKVYKEMTNRKGVDVVVDSVGKETFSTSLRMLKPNGRIVTCGATTGPKTQLDIRQIFWKQLEILGSTMSNMGEFHDVMDLVLKGELEPVIDKKFSLENAAEAETYLGKGKQFGKVLLEF